MAQPGPTPAFQSVLLDIATLRAGERFGRIYLHHHPDPLGYDKSPSRFSDPRRRKAENRFGVLYLGASLTVCFLEAILRDQRNGAVSDYPIDESELHVRKYATVEVTNPLSLVRLRGNGPVKMGIPSDVTGASRQSLSRAWSLALHEHPAKPDGILYASRLNGETNIAVYDRAISKLYIQETCDLISAPGLAHTLNELRAALA